MDAQHRRGKAGRKRERWILQTWLFSDSKWGGTAACAVECRRREMTIVGEEGWNVYVGAVKEKSSLS